MTPAVTTKVEDDGTVRLTLACDECGSRMHVTISDVPAFTRKAVEAVVASAVRSSSSSGRVRVICSGCALGVS